MKFTTEQEERNRIKQRIRKSKESIDKVSKRLNNIRRKQLYEHIDCSIKIRQLKFEFAEVSNKPASSDHNLWQQETKKTRLEELARSINLLKDTIEINTIINYLQETKHQNVITCLEQNIAENKTLLDQEYNAIAIKQEIE